MDINQNQQTNTFLKGMNTDTSDFLLQNDQYRYAENVRIVTDNENNTGELHLIEGTNKILDLPEGETIIATNYIRDIAVYITRSDSGWRVYKRIGNDESQLVFGPCEEKIWDDDKPNEKSITTVMRYESPNNIKLYIADGTGKHSIMVLNISKEYGDSNFDDVFGYQRTLLPPVDIKKSNDGGTIVSGQVQYAYRLYSKNNPSTQVSILSKTLPLYKNSFSGYESEKNSGCAVDIIIPVEKTSNLDYIQIYRISYQISGQLPKIHLIKDEKIKSKIVDNGINIEEVSISDFLTMATSQIFPSQIESKGDYLFAGNMKYSQDDVDKLFENFDARSFSAGNYIQNGDDVQYIIDSEQQIFISDVDTEYLKHQAFDNNQYLKYNQDFWYKFQFGDISCNGYGKCICWEYTYDIIQDENSDLILPSPDNQMGGISTFRSGEVYRFGIRLFNDKGQASSVKWIADIMIPPGANITYDLSNNKNTAKFRNVGIRFFKNPDANYTECWKNVKAFEIVRCERTLQDRKAITQGIVGFPVREYSNKNGQEENTKMICTPGVFSTDEFRINSQVLNYNLLKEARTDNSILMFSSPEYCYQQDDIKDILKQYNSQLYLTKIYNTDPRSTYNTYDNIVRSIQTLQSSNESLSYPFPVDGAESAGPNNYIFSWNPITIGIGPDGYFEYLLFGKGTIDSTDTETRWYINYVTPNYSKFNAEDQSYYVKYDIGETSFSESPKSSDFAKNEILTFKDSVTTIDNLQFINWSAPLLLDLQGDDESIVKRTMSNVGDLKTIHSGGNKEREIWLRKTYPIGSGGKTILFKTKDKLDVTYTPKNIDNCHFPSITVMNVNKPVNPYGGYNKSAIDNSSYISFGDYCEYTSDAEIKVFSGDTKIRIFTYHALHNWYDSEYKRCLKMATVYAIPVETDIDIQAQYGELYGVDNFIDYRIQDTPDAFDTYTQEKSAYLYNTAYNATPDIISWTTPEMLETKQDYFDTRIHYSNVKTNNEDIDSWTQFAAMNYLDVDSRFGQITDLKLFKDKLIFWQENAIGILAVNERVVLNDQNDTQVVLGTGGVLERYDYFSTVYGQKKNQHVRTTSNDSLYWWDGNNKEILVYTQKYNVTPLSSIKNIKNYINEKDETDVPFLTYDNKYKEVIANVVGEDDSIVYSEQIEAFTSIYKFSPIFDLIINGKLLLTSNNALYDYNKCIENKSTLFENNAHPYIKYIVNANNIYTKTYDIQQIGGRFYGGGYDEEYNNDKHHRNNYCLNALTFYYDTPLKQKSQGNGKDIITNVEYDFRLTIPRAGYEIVDNNGNKKWKTENYGDRMKGKTMQCSIKSNSNDLDFSLQYVITKFRMSWN